jgi:DNA gyrase subunit A
VMGRATQGVRLINLRDEDAIASVAKVEVDETPEDEIEEFDDEIVDDDTVNGENDV